MACTQDITPSSVVPFDTIDIKCWDKTIGNIEDDYSIDGIIDGDMISEVLAATQDDVPDVDDMSLGSLDLVDDKINDFGYRQGNVGNGIVSNHQYSRLINNIERLMTNLNVPQPVSCFEPIPVSSTEVQPRISKKTSNVSRKQDRQCNGNIVSPVPSDDDIIFADLHKNEIDSSKRIPLPVRSHPFHEDQGLDTIMRLQQKMMKRQMSQHKSKVVETPKIKPKMQKRNVSKTSNINNKRRIKQESSDRRAAASKNENKCKKRRCESTIDDNNTPMSKLQKLMMESRKTQEDLQNYDKKRGLPKNHSITMVNTSRSRIQLLNGVVLKTRDGRPLLEAVRTAEGKFNCGPKKNRKKKTQKCEGYFTNNQ